MSNNLYDPDTKELLYLGRGWAYPFNFGEHGGVDNIANYLGDYTGIKMSLFHILGCHVGRRRMLRAFGGDLHRFLFEPLVEELVDDAVDFVERAITKWEPRVTLNAEGSFPAWNKPPRLGVHGRIVVPLKRLEITTDFMVIKTQHVDNLVVVVDADLKRVIPILNAI